MKPRSILTAILGTALVCALPSAKAGKSFGDGKLPEFLKVYDANGDGAIDEEERQVMEQVREQMRETKRECWDTNGDGKIDDAECEQARVRLRQKIEDKRKDCFAEADANGDGVLDYDEWAAIPAVARLLEADPEAAQAIFDRMKGDDDVISEEEFLLQLRKRHGRPPAAGDGIPDGPNSGETTPPGPETPPGDGSGA